jgi:MYXO-CTERM domain-containing protein
MCPTGQRCDAGACIDLCAGVVCPGGGLCVNGSCQMGTGSDPVTGGGTTGTIDIPGGIVIGGSNGLGSGANGSVLPGGHVRGANDPGCACEVVGQSPAGDAALVFGGLGAALAMARRRRRA